MHKLSSLAIVAFSFVLYTCSSSKEEASSAESEAISPVEVIRESVHIDYQSCGDKDTTLLFVHGWCIDQAYWSAQVDAFCKDYRVVTMDLPGSGKSGKNRDSWTVEDYGEDVAAVIDQLDLQNVVLIGHSMGGNVILEAALAKPQPVIALIGVDNFKDVGEAMNEEIQAKIDNFMMMMEQDFANTASAYAQQALFHPSTDSAVVQRVTNDFRNSDPDIATASLKALLDYGHRESEQLANLDKKLYLINSDATPTSTAGLDETGVNYQLVDIHATGHYPMIEKPEEFNRLLREILAKIHT